jgi:hypothetical protein
MKNGRLKFISPAKKLYRQAGHIFSLLRAPELKDIGNKKLV